jgi:hypothetical protein
MEIYQLVNLIEKLLTKESGYRLEAVDALNHTFLTKSIDKKYLMSETVLE